MTTAEGPADAAVGDDTGLAEEILAGGPATDRRMPARRGVIGTPWPATVRPRSLRRIEWWALGLSALVAMLLPTLVVGGIDPPGRAVLAVLFVVSVPGVPVAIALCVPDRRITTILAVALSLTTTLLAGALAGVTGYWSPTGAAVVIGALGVVATGVATARGLRAGRREAASRPGVGPAPENPSRATGGVTADRRPPSADRPSDRRPARRFRAAALLVVGGALCLWWAATLAVGSGEPLAVGLVAQVPWTYWASTALLVAVLATVLTRPVVDHVVAAVAVAALILVLVGTVNAADGAGSVGAGWVHVGFIDLISGTGRMATGLDARFSWPGFLSGAAHLVSWAGLSDAGPLLVLAPVVFGWLAMPALWMTARVITGSDRLAWLGVTVCLLANWYQQDYFSSQATAFVLVISVLAVLLWAVSTAAVPIAAGGRRSRWTRWMATARRVPGRPAGLGPGGMLALEVCLILVSAAIVVSHQLTPLLLIGWLTWFAVAGATRWRTLWLVAAAIFVGWFSYGATDFWAGHLQTVLGDLGQVSATVSAGVADRIVGDPLYQRMQLTRVAWTGLLAVTAAAGWLLVRRRTGSVLVAGLAVVPFGLVGVQSYGGEVIIRCALYAGPVLAPLAAVAIARLGCWLISAAPAARGPVLAVLLLVGAAGLTTTRGLNVSFERVTGQQVASARAVLDRAAPGDVIGTAGLVGPLPMGRLTDVARIDLDPAWCDVPLPDCVLMAAGSPGPDYVYITSGQEALGRLQGSRPAGWTEQIVDTLLATGAYLQVQRTPEVTILQRVGMIREVGR